MNSAGNVDSPEVRQAFQFCRAVARKEAKNFYYSFRILPKAKRDAMCAIYAFMRHADDIADTETLPLAERRVVMSTWLDQWRAFRNTPGSPADPVFLAVAETQRRFNIPDSLLEDLVRGTSMDLYPDAAGAGIDLGDGLQGYRTFADLYQYCYLVASVVGLVCIRIFGYTDPAAELLAEQTGVAFQLTNILRDVKEDALRGRIYLPQELLAEFHVSNADVLALAAGKPIEPNQRAMLSALAVQASEYYGSGWKLLPLVDRDSRASLWVLIAIYNRLLRRIEAEGTDVFTHRISVPSSEKMLILARGFLKVLWWRKGRRD